MMDRKLSGSKRHFNRAAVVEPGNGLAPRQQIVLVIGFDMLLVGPLMAAGQHLHAAVFGCRVGEGEPERNDVVRIEAVIGGIPVP